MAVPAAYLGIILIWSTTPLAIQWSSEGVGFLFGVTMRMTIAVVLCLVLMRLLRVPMRWRGQEAMTYVASSLGIYFAMMSVYWGAQYIPSGLISVIYGLLPIVTTVVAGIWFGESLNQPGKLLALVFGVIGLAIIFNPQIDLSGEATMLLGGMAVLASVVIHSVSMVWIKRMGVDVNPVAVTTGGLMLAVPLYLITWLVVDGQWPAQIVSKAAWSIVYLGVIGSVVGFILYYYVLKRLAPEVVALITLITPVCALTIGYWVNHERIGLNVAFGVVLIMLALIVHQWGMIASRKKLELGEETD